LSKLFLAEEQSMRHLLDSVNEAIVIQACKCGLRSIFLIFFDHHPATVSILLPKTTDLVKGTMRRQEQAGIEHDDSIAKSFKDFELKIGESEGWND
jgi:hypothetical protein